MINYTPSGVFYFIRIYFFSRIQAESTSSTESKPNLLLQYRLAGDADTKLLENLLIHITQHHGAMSLTATELWQLLQCLPAILIIL